MQPQQHTHMTTDDGSGSDRDSGGPSGRTEDEQTQEDTRVANTEVHHHISMTAGSTIVSSSGAALAATTGVASAHPTNMYSIPMHDEPTPAEFAQMSRSERKRHREKRRRFEVNRGFDDLKDILGRIDPSILSRSSSNASATGGGGGGGGGGDATGDDTPMNRVELIGRTCQVLMHQQETIESLRQQLATQRPQGNDRIVKTGEGAPTMNVGYASASHANQWSQRQSQDHYGTTPMQSVPPRETGTTPGAEAAEAAAAATATAASTNRGVGPSGEMLTMAQQMNPFDENNSESGLPTLQDPFQPYSVDPRTTGTSKRRQSGDFQYRGGVGSEPEGSERYEQIAPKRAREDTEAHQPSPTPSPPLTATVTQSRGESDDADDDYHEHHNVDPHQQRNQQELHDQLSPTRPYAQTHPPQPMYPPMGPPPSLPYSPIGTAVPPHQPYSRHPMMHPYHPHAYAPPHFPPLNEYPYTSTVRPPPYLPPSGQTAMSPSSSASTTPSPHHMQLPQQAPSAPTHRQGYDAGFHPPPSKPRDRQSRR